MYIIHIIASYTYNLLMFPNSKTNIFYKTIDTVDTKCRSNYNRYDYLNNPYLTFPFRFPSDVWSAGCVLAELLLGQPIFPGDSGVDQLVEIIKVLGTPTREQIKEMNPNYTEFKFPQIKSHPWQKVSTSRARAISCSVRLTRNAIVILLQHHSPDNRSTI